MERDWRVLAIEQDLGLGMMLWLAHFFPQEPWARAQTMRALRTIDGVENAYVTNVSGPAGERVGAAVVCARTLTAEQLSASARKLLSAFKVPTVIVFRDEPLPRNAAGKVLKRELKEGLVGTLT